MSKLNANTEEGKNRIIRGSIKNAQSIQDINVSKLSKLTGIPASTLYQKMRNPEKFTIEELRIVFKVLRYRQEEKERIAREAI